MLVALAAWWKVTPTASAARAGFCLWLAAKFPGAAIGAALKKMGLDLIKDSEALDRERAVLSHRRAGNVIA